MKKLLLVGALPEVLEARRVVLEGAGYAVRLLEAGEPLRQTAEVWGASLIVFDAGSGTPELRHALEELSEPGRPSTIPVLVVGAAEEVDRFSGPCGTVPRPAEKRRLLESARMLIRSREDAPRSWSRKRAT